MHWPAFGLPTNWTAWDWAIVLVLLGAVGAVGVYAKRYVANAADFLAAGRTLKTDLAVTTMVGTDPGLLAVMYAGQAGFLWGFAAFHVGLAVGLAMLAVAMTGFVVVPLRKMRMLTIPEFYRKRFGPGVGVAGGAILALAGMLHMGLFLQVAALFLAGVTGLANPLHLRLIVVGLLAVVILYTVVGGMVSVVLTGYLRFVALVIALLATSLLAIQTLETDTIIFVVEEVRGEGGFNPFHAHGLGAENVVWMAFLALSSAVAWLPIVSRGLSARNVTVVRQTYALSAIGLLARWLVPCFLGICAITFFSRHPQLQKVFLSRNAPPSAQTALMAMPVFLGRSLPPGLLGLVAAGLLVAIVSAHDTFLLSWSSVLTQDVLAPCLRRGLSPQARLRVMRVTILLMGGSLLIWGMWCPIGQDLWGFLVLASTVYFAGAFAVLTLGIYWRRASRFGAYLALGCGLLGLLGLKSVQGALGLSLSQALVGLGTAALSVAAMVVGSLLVPDRAADTNADTAPARPAADPPDGQE